MKPFLCKQCAECGEASLLSYELPCGHKRWFQTTAVPCEDDECEKQHFLVGPLRIHLRSNESLPVSLKGGKMTLTDDTCDGPGNTIGVPIGDDDLTFSFSSEWVRPPGMVKAALAELMEGAPILMVTADDVADEIDQHKSVAVDALKGLNSESVEGLLCNHWPWG